MQSSNPSFFRNEIAFLIHFPCDTTFMYDNDIPYNNTYVDANGVTQKKTSKEDPGVGLGWVQLKQIFNIGIEYKF